MNPRDELRTAVAMCVADGRVFDGLATIFRDVDERVARVGAVCLGGGCCCRFALAGHRLYVSTAELALLLSGGPPVRPAAGPLECPFQQGPACHARHRRPLGCRTFFCRVSRDDQAVLTDLYESAHALIRRLHESLNVPYVYSELTAAIGHVTAD
jgi:hypothetical protein